MKDSLDGKNKGRKTELLEIEMNNKKKKLINVVFIRCSMPFSFSKKKKKASGK